MIKLVMLTLGMTISMYSFIFTGGKNGCTGKNQPSWCNDDSECDNHPTQTRTLSIGSFPDTYPGRNNIYSTIPYPSFTSGPSVPTIDAALTGATYFFEITVTGTGDQCDYEESYIWDGGYDMNIQIPEDMGFTISADFYEGCEIYDEACGGFSGNGWGKPLYGYEETFGSPSSAASQIFMALNYLGTDCC